MPLAERFTQYIVQKNLFTKKDHLLVAVSGGVDSVVLCELCHKCGYHFSIAHCNFQLRDLESESDEALVKTISEKYGVDLFIKKFDTKNYAAQNKISIQVAARELRYQWFDEVLKSMANLYSAVYLLTAHHADDSVETVLMNFFKGTGIKGLHGILPKQNKITRPLLFAKKEEIISFANDHELAYAEDSSNLLDKYTRNYFRNQIIPSLQKIFPAVQDNLINNIERFNDAGTLYDQAINFHKKRLLEYKGNEVHIPVLKLRQSEPLQTILYEIISAYNFTPHQATDVLHLLQSETGKQVLSSTHIIFRNRKWLIISPKKNREAAHIIIQENDTAIEFENGIITFKKIIADGVKPSSVLSCAKLDMKMIQFPLLLRKWKQGDYFYPLGMQHKKKLSRFFIDQKTALSDKEKIWVIESNKKILWVIGLRIDDRFKLTEHTKNILQIDFTGW